MSDNKAIFPIGIYFDRPRDNAPDFIKGKISIKVDDAIPFLKTYRSERGYVTLDLKKSRDGKLYLQLNTFVPEIKKPESFAAAVDAPRTEEKLSDGSDQPNFEIKDADIPF